MDDIQSFLSPSHPSLKICGVTLAPDAEALVALNVPALGVNFWPKSKRYCSPEKALQFLPALAGQIVRVGVFVNNAREISPILLEKEAIDIVQLHGDEDDEQLLEFLQRNIPVIRSLALKPNEDLHQVIEHYKKLQEKYPNTLTLLLDTHAPGVYGGTGETIDWKQAAEFIQLASPSPVLLAGGITPNNSKEAIQTTQPCGLDIASGAESSPGIKDLAKVTSLLTSTLTTTSP